VQHLVDAALGDLFPKKYEEWLDIKQYIRDVFLRQRREKESAVTRDIADTENSLQHALREEVIDHVISIFPYVLFRSYLDRMQKVVT